MYNTRNPVPSSALEDMADNAQTFDALVTKTEGTTTDRLGRTRRVFQQILMDMGFQPLAGSFQTGATITARNQTLYDEVSHVFYAWGGALPKIVPAGSTPATSGGIGVGAWSDKTDLTLRMSLKNKYPIDFGYTGLVSETNSYINFIDSEPAFAYGDVALGGGTDTQIALSKIGNFDMLKINGIQLKSPFVGGKPLKIPPAFPWNPGIQCFANSYGSVITPYFDASLYDFTLNPSVSYTTLYVDPVNGNNFQPIPNDSLPNAGTDPLLPLKSVTAAFDRITSNSYLYTKILLTGGYYYDANSWGSRSPTSNVVVKQWQRGDNRDKSRPVLSSETSVSWSLESGNVYKASRTAVSWLLDASSYNEYGDWFGYTKVSSIAECQALAGSWYQASGGSLVYVHTLNGDAPTSVIHPIVSKANAGCSAGNYTLYIEGIDFFGGSTAGFSADSRTSNTSDTLVAKNCRFLYSNGNGFENYGISTCITQDCVIAYTVGDGFNYHSNRDDLTQVCKSLEINNRTYMTGRSDSPNVDSSNGSTCHDSNIVIRLGCSYEKSVGPVVADVNSCKTYNFCVSARESIRAGSSPRKSSFLASGNGCEQYIDNSQAVNSLWSLDCYNLAKMYVEDVYIDSSIEGIENISKIQR